MDTFEAQLSKYVDIVLTLGLNFQPGQVLVVGVGALATPIEAVEFVRLVARRAYELGARDVHVLWGDDELARLRVQHAAAEALSEMPSWKVKWFEDLASQGAAFLGLYAPNSDLFRGVDPQRTAATATAANRAYSSFSAARGRMEFAWALVSVATRAWARKVFPQQNDADAIQSLWEYIFRATRITTPDPSRAWVEHLDRLNERTALLNQARLTKLHYRAPGTALSIALPSRHVWVSGGGTSNARGIRFVPNVPTEEVFTVPARDGINGTVCSTLPLNYNGTLIENLRLRFEQGRIVDYAADQGYETLKGIIETDEGSHYLGEVALVTADSPTNFGTPLYNTLFDENASCHLAIGMALPICLEGGEHMSPEDLATHGANHSEVHVDFMVGSTSLDVDGETATGERVPVLRGGMWAMDATA